MPYQGLHVVLGDPDVVEVDPARPCPARDDVFVPPHGGDAVGVARHVPDLLRGRDVPEVHLAVVGAQAEDVA